VSDGLLVAQAAAAVGVPAGRLRRWEASGLVTPARTPSGYRVYGPGDLERARRVRDLYASGLNTAGVRRALSEPAPPATATLGARLKARRVSEGVSLRELAARTGVSASHLSAIERDVTHPSVAVLQKAAAALDTSVVGLLGGPPAGGRAVVRAGERPALEGRLQGVRIEQLAVVESVLESLLFHVEPGGGSESYSHPGEEFLFMLAGTLEVVLDEAETHVLGPGDAMTFASHRRHRFRNPGDETAQVVWVNTPPTF
jgi:DNA-binding transcriptional MerR regulator/quercetin dioxygenase-like cupin family protein